VIAYGCLIRREGARREHLDYIYRGLMSQHPRFTATLYLTDVSSIFLKSFNGLITHNPTKGSDHAQNTSHISKFRII